MVGLASLDPIRTKLSDDILQKFAIIKELKQAWMLFAAADAGSGSNGALESPEQVAESLPIVQDLAEQNNPVPQDRSRSCSAGRLPPSRSSTCSGIALDSEPDRVQD